MVLLTAAESFEYKTSASDAEVRSNGVTSRPVYSRLQNTPARPVRLSRESWTCSRCLDFFFCFTIAYCKSKKNNKKKKDATKGAGSLFLWMLIESEHGMNWNCLNGGPITVTIQSFRGEWHTQRGWFISAVAWLWLLPLSTLGHAQWLKNLLLLGVFVGVAFKLTRNGQTRFTWTVSWYWHRQAGHSDLWVW